MSRWLNPFLHIMFSHNEATTATRSLLPMPTSQEMAWHNINQRYAVMRLASVDTDGTAVMGPFDPQTMTHRKVFTVFLLVGELRQFFF